MLRNARFGDGARMRDFPLSPRPLPPAIAAVTTDAAMIARLVGEPARGPSLFSQTLTDENDIVTFERATPEQEAFVRTMLEGVDPDIFKAETGLEKGVALPEYPRATVTSITLAGGFYRGDEHGHLVKVAEAEAVEMLRQPNADAYEAPDDWTGEERDAARDIEGR